MSQLTVAIIRTTIAGLIMSTAHGHSKEHHVDTVLCGREHYKRGGLTIINLVQRWTESMSVLQGDSGSEIRAPTFSDLILWCQADGYMNVQHGVFRDFDRAIDPMSTIDVVFPQRTPSRLPFLTSSLAAPPVPWPCISRSWLPDGENCHTPNSLTPVRRSRSVRMCPDALFVFLHQLLQLRQLCLIIKPQGLSGWHKIIHPPSFPEAL